MQRWLTNALILLVIFSIRANTMEDESFAMKLPDELLFQCLTEDNLDIESIITFPLVCKKWDTICSTDAFWKAKYIQKRGCEIKLRDGISYKENYRCVLFVCHRAPSCTLEKYPYVYKNKHMICPETFIPDSLDASEVNALYKKALEGKPQVFCSCFGPLISDDSQLWPFIVECLKQALDEDVLFVLCVGDSEKEISITIEGNNLHETFPNVLWAAACDEKGIPMHSNSGEIVDIAVTSLDGTASSAIVLAQFVTYLRTLKPLSAKIVRQLILSTATNQNNIKKLNCEAAIKAVKEYSHPQ